MRDPFTIDKPKALSGATELADLEDVDGEQLAACLDDHAGDGAEVIHSQATAYVRPFPVDQVEVLQTAFAALKAPDHTYVQSLIQWAHLVRLGVAGAIPTAGALDPAVAGEPLHCELG